ncbi:unnamed protein product [Cylindrotheca closterium]|uniref:Palmitoyltransferase n=1 Tax=Cylindrotheca closterium TaxID=2856 RepID=A0AAD2FUW6_9STRA|nr:unnamed protein product [Cylindrotheca closterium]
MTDSIKDRVEEGENLPYQVQGSSSNTALNIASKSSLDNEGARVANASVEEGGSRTIISYQTTELDWKLLPPLPAPQEAKHKEFRCGSFVLGGAASLCFVAVLSAFGLSNAQSNIADSIFVAAVSSLFFVELLCLLAIYHKDPGVVKRSPFTCHPIPPQVQPYVRSYIQTHQQQPNKSNGENDALVQEMVPAPSELYISMQDENNSDNGEDLSSIDTYCVRCLVWRRGKKKYFHCNTCQRCVSHYDHHCNVFGRCIAGRLPFQGNLPLFYMAVGASVLLYATTAIGLAWKLGTGGLI